MLNLSDAHPTTLHIEMRSSVLYIKLERQHSAALNEYRKLEKIQVPRNRKKLIERKYLKRDLIVYA